MTDGELRKLIQRGSGRAILYLREVGGDAHAKVVRDACLHDQAFDRQCENFNDYALRLLQTLADPEEMVEPLGRALFRSRIIHDRCQVRFLLGHFAKGGSEKARAFLRADLRRARLKDSQVEVAPFHLGEEGLEMALRYTDRLEDWEQKWLFDNAVEVLGRRRTIAIVRKRARVSKKARQFLDQVLHPKTAKYQPPRELTPEQVLEALRSGQHVLAPRFAKQATHEQLVEAAQICLARIEAGVRLPSFRDFVWPLDVNELLVRAEREQESRKQRYYFHLLSATVHPALREWALPRLESSPFAWDFLRANALPSDFAAIKQALPRLRGWPDGYHWATLSLLGMKLRIPTSILRMLLDAGRCGICRDKVVDLLIRRRAFIETDWMALCEDAEERLRTRARRRMRGRLRGVAEPLNATPHT